MTRIIQVPVFQGHPVPDRPHAPRGPFPPELLRRPERAADVEPQPDGGGESLPMGATAQNNYRPVRWFRCRDCSEVLAEADLDDHTCEEPWREE